MQVGHAVTEATYRRGETVAGGKGHSRANRATTEAKTIATPHSSRTTAYEEMIRVRTSADTLVLAGRSRRAYSVRMGRLGARQVDGNRNVLDLTNEEMTP